MAENNTARKLLNPDSSPLEENSGTPPFNYDLPDELIAERPCYPFHEARLLAVDRANGLLNHSEFSYLPLMLSSNDVLVVNNTRVLKARLFGNLEKNGSAIELLLLEELATPGRWKAMGRPLKKLKAGECIRFSSGLKAHVIDRVDDYVIEIQFASSSQNDIFCNGTMPIPPYIRSGKGDQRDEVDYQTAFARHEGSVAAPTAGLHFTEELLDVLKRRGVEIVEVTLHVGSASFLSVWAEEQSGEVAFSPPGVERGRIEQETLERLRQLKLEGRRIIAVGTTVVRLLETIFSSLNPHAGGEVRTDLFIRPGYRFRAVDSMITNFHQPQSSHLLLVEAFMGRSLLKESYEAAVQSRYRFLSYGDGMFIE